MLLQMNRTIPFSYTHTMQVVSNNNISVLVTTSFTWLTSSQGFCYYNLSGMVQTIESTRMHSLCKQFESLPCLHFFTEQTMEIGTDKSLQLGHCPQKLSIRLLKTVLHIHNSLLKDI